jgi:flavin-dependent dehydrogenase
MEDTMQDVVDVVDVVVIGGGPAGASTAGLLAQRGHRVLVLEREKFPRYHIGESLAAGCLAVIDELGLKDRLEAMGFVKKYGGSLVWGRHKNRWAFRFVEGTPYEYAYQVRRADFDALLLTRARELGALVLEEATVKDAVIDGDRVVGVKYALRGRNSIFETKARQVIDASGQARVLGHMLATVDWYDELRAVAVWGYFQGCGQLEGDEAGNILIENVPGGWFWGIPLYDGTMSVGYVTPVSVVVQSDLGLPDLFTAQLKVTTELKRLMRNARQVSGFRSARDWSYACSSFHGPGWALVGDAAAFIDPLFSTGITLATVGASALAKTVDAVLSDPSLEQQAMSVYEASYRDFLDSIRSYIEYFYDGTRDRELYYKRAQAIIDPERMAPARADFVTLISGVTGAKPIFHAPVAQPGSVSPPIGASTSPL